MIDTVLYFLPCLIFIGLVTSYSDLKEGKIRNKWIIVSICYSIVMNIYLFFSAGLLSNYSYFLETIINFLFSVILGFFLWTLGIWTAGDGKLFIAFSSLLPISSYSIGYQKWTPSLILVLNTFVMSFLILLVFIISKVNKERDLYAKITKKLPRIKDALLSLVSLFAISWIVQLILNIVGINITYYFLFFIILLAYFLIYKILNKFSIYILILVSIARIFLDRSVFSLEFLLDFIGLFFGWLIIGFLLNGAISTLGDSIFTKKINTTKLKKGMILAESIKVLDLDAKIKKNKEGKRLFRYKGKYLSVEEKKISNKGSFLEETPEGLTVEQIKKIRKAGIKRISVAKTIPFAPILFLGTIVTLLVKGNLLIFIWLIFFHG